MTLPNNTVVSRATDYIICEIAQASCYNQRFQNSRSWSIPSQHVQGAKYVDSHQIRTLVVVYLLLWHIYKWFCPDSQSCSLPNFICPLVACCIKLSVCKTAYIWIFVNKSALFQLLYCFKSVYIKSKNKDFPSLYWFLCLSAAFLVCNVNHCTWGVLPWEDPALLYALHTYYFVLPFIGKHKAS